MKINKLCFKLIAVLSLAILFSGTSFAAAKRAVKKKTPKKPPQTASQNASVIPVAMDYAGKSPIKISLPENTQ